MRAVNRWAVIVILAAAQFVMVLDSSVMNVSISQIVADLDTTIEGVQTAITAYTLVMAAFMLVGAKLGDIFGRDRVFAIGLAIYGIGSLATALSPNLGVLLLGWSLIEGIGAVLVVPAIAALIAAHYQGRERALAYGIIGGIAAAAVAAGPLIGGWITTVSTWRLVFAGETVIVLGILLAHRRMRVTARPEAAARLDVVGAALAAPGLALIVFAVLRSSAWGWVQPRQAPVIGGIEIAPFGFSVVPFLVLAGLALLWAFASWEGRRLARGEDVLVDVRMFSLPTLRAGLSTLFMMQLIILGTFFALPVYLQVVLGLDAFETGMRLVPMSLTMLLAAVSGPRVAARLSPRTAVRIGLGALTIGALIVLSAIDVALARLELGIGLAVFGVGAGLLASQLGNVVMSSVPASQTNEAGGLQGTAQNLGASFGTALIGAILLGGLTSGFVDRVSADPALPTAVRAQLVELATSSGLSVVPVADVEAAVLAAGLSPAQAGAIAQDYGAAQLEGLRAALGGVALAAVLAFWFTRRIPGRRPVGATVDETADLPGAVPDLPATIDGTPPQRGLAGAP
jgi:MFS family permease